MTNPNAQMAVTIDRRTGMVMCVATRNETIDMRGYGPCCDYEGVEWDYD